jgi:hypothetical protein
MQNVYTNTYLSPEAQPQHALAPLLLRLDADDGALLKAGQHPHIDPVQVCCSLQQVASAHAVSKAQLD